MFSNDSNDITHHWFFFILSTFKISVNTKGVPSKYTSYSLQPLLSFIYVKTIEIASFNQISFILYVLVVCCRRRSKWEFKHLI